MTKEEIKIKELISGQVDMGTFGLVELELRELVKSVESERINGKEAELSAIIYDLKKQQSKHEQEMEDFNLFVSVNFMYSFEEKKWYHNNFAKHNSVHYEKHYNFTELLTKFKNR